MTAHSKRLRALTIVPDALYVNRAADRQLERVIEEMGRPGYVLVARQMGKTNLLLHMKRSRERNGDTVCYFDLSTRHKTLRSFFRALIDAICESFAEYALSEQIRLDREKGWEPNVEYDRHLRLLAGHRREGRLVILLDEIDSLIGVPYSDKVLAQIRSMYFARANHPIYEAVTYVLSGVAEPSDLIKDKNISPFNIGEKIYLENFSLSELSELVAKSDLSVGLDVIERVYYWTSGNPRMSWDILSSLEDVQSSGELLTPQSVDLAVEKVYLRDYDRAPIDHIRTLVQSDRVLRDGIMSIHYGKGDALDDVVRSRLYLAGITTAPSENIEINNRITSAALTTEWVSRIGAGTASVLESARRHYGERDFSGAVRLFESFLEEVSGSDSALGRVQLMEFGIALYHLQRFDEAQRQLKDSLDAEGLEELRPSILFYLASSKLKGGDPETSLEIFEALSSEAGDFQNLARLGLCAALIAMSPSANSARIIEVSQDIIANAIPQNGNEDRESELASSALYNLAQGYMAAGKIPEAIDALDTALGVAPPDMAPSIYLTKISALGDTPGATAALRQITEMLEQNLPIARRYGSTTLSFSKFTLGSLAAKAISLEDEDVAQRLILLAQKSLDEPSVGRVAVKILESSRSETEHSALLPLIEAGLSSARDDGLRPVDILTLSKAAVVSAPDAGKSIAFDRYVALISENISDFSFEFSDGIICIGQLSLEVASGDRGRIEKVISFFDGHRDAFKKSQAFIYAFYLNQKVVFFQSIQNNDAARICAQEIVDLLADSTFSAELAEAGVQSLIKQIQDNAQSLLRIGAPDKFRRLKRNQLVRYLDTRTGQRKVAKFKKIEKEVRAGIFELELTGALTSEET